MKTNNIETRFFGNEDIELRSEESNGRRFITGYAAKYGVRSKLISEKNQVFYETLNRGSFDDVLQREDLDVKLLFNHDKNKILGRYPESLEIFTDEKGLGFRAEIPMEVSYASDVYNLVKRGILKGNSFAFRCDPNDCNWGKDESGIRTREINKISGLYDVSVVVDPAYPNTEVAARSIEELERAERAEKEEEPKKYPTDSFKRRLKTLKLKIN
ncbi:MAG TPA: HK97 family phage prohead protease [Candidatus Paceibacterota bacterium]|nr:HK97 family phage prohead protease [Candidatus Paceibacterota bacterium]